MMSALLCIGATPRAALVAGLRRVGHFESFGGANFASGGATSRPTSHALRRSQPSVHLACRTCRQGDTGAVATALLPDR